MPKVYVPQESLGKNIIPAMSYGQIRVCFPQDYQVGFFVEDAVEKLRTFFSEYRQEDYILLMGDPVLIGLSVAMAAKHTPVINLLKWDRQEHIYIPITANLEDVDESTIK
jgi:hypothetical protein